MMSLSKGTPASSQIVWLEGRISELESQLTAEREARQKAEADLLAHKEMLRQEMRETNKAHSRADAAEARIKASQEQEPYAYWHIGSNEDEDDVFKASESGDVSCPDCLKLYLEPIIPPEVAELQRDLSAIAKQRDDLMQDNLKMVEENVVLTRKLAEQQAMFVEMGKHPDNPSLYAMYMRYRNYYNANEPAELTKLLEEAKRQAVPEGWQLVPIEPTEEMVACLDDESRIAFYADRYKAALSAAPQPERKD